MEQKILKCWECGEPADDDLKDNDGRDYCATCFEHCVDDNGKKIKELCGLCDGTGVTLDRKDPRMESFIECPWCKGEGYKQYKNPLSQIL